MVGVLLMVAITLILSGVVWVMVKQMGVESPDTSSVKEPNPEVPCDHSQHEATTELESSPGLNPVQLGTVPQNPSDPSRDS